ncbi:unannotated protein [freshwater metagenome]|uniref:Unannotated protein n=1 Tax=freshwater metagenome TaxID=449393 RepID=A0A6J6FIN5_9ZZZZ
MRLVADLVDIGITTHLAPVDLEVALATARFQLVPVPRDRALLGGSDTRPTSMVVVVVVPGESAELGPHPMAVRADWACLRRFPVRRSSMRAVVEAVCTPLAQRVRVEVVWAEPESLHRGRRPGTVSMAVVVAVVERDEPTQVRVRVVTVVRVSSSFVTRPRASDALLSARPRVRTRSSRSRTSERARGLCRLASRTSTTSSSVVVAAAVRSSAEEEELADSARAPVCFSVPSSPSRLWWAMEVRAAK